MLLIPWCEYRQLLLLDDGTVFMGDGDRIFKLSPPSTAATTYTLAGFQTNYLQTNAEERHLHWFAYAGTNCMVSVIEIGGFNTVYQRQVQCSSTAPPDTHTQLFQAGYYQSSSTDDTIFFQVDTRFFRIRNDYLGSSYVTQNSARPWISCVERTEPLLHEQRPPLLTPLRDILRYKLQNLNWRNQLYHQQVNIQELFIVSRKDSRWSLYDYNKFFVSVFYSYNVLKRPSL
ncbi:hypothetical protein FGO68_gene17390 [Halteria grandinella]|uniref:Uncharacterized protein n=1 Tax=Halteria grandinella TaxID=5974 RepID=A0A8J8P6Q5_HALGN|nr:hypothetical protein FGO68_gene17390 [Halteria grandinella]